MRSRRHVPLMCNMQHLHSFPCSRYMARAATGERPRRDPLIKARHTGQLYTKGIGDLSLLTVSLQIIYQVEAKCWEVSRKVGRMIGFLSKEGWKTRPYPTWGLQTTELAALCWRKHDLVKSPEFPSCSNSFSGEQKGRSFFLTRLPSCVTLTGAERATVVPCLHALAFEVGWSCRRQGGNLAREKQPLWARELSGSQSGDYFAAILPHSCIYLIRLSLNDSAPGLVSHRFYLCVMRCNKQDRKLIGCFFFLSFIPWWWRIHMKVPEVQPLLFLFPSTLFVFSGAWLNYSLSALSSSEFLKVSVVKSAQSLLNLEKEAEEGNSVPAACASQYFLAPCSGWGWTLQPALQSLFLWEYWGPKVQSHLQPDYSFFLQWCARKKGPCLVYHPEHNYYFVLNKWCLSAVCCVRVLFFLEKKIPVLGYRCKDAGLLYQVLNSYVFMPST